MCLQVKATNGDTFLGGEDFDNVLLQVRILGCTNQSCQVVKREERLCECQQSPEQRPPM